MDGGAAGGGGASALRLSLARLGRAAKLGLVLRHGLRVDTRRFASCRLAATLTVRSKVARRLGLGRVTRLASASGSGAADRTTRLRLRVAVKAARRLRTAGVVPATLKVTATGAERATVTRALRLER